jgi:hypothetical protein
MEFIKLINTIRILSPISSERLSLFGFSSDHHQPNICIKESPISSSIYFYMDGKSYI